MMRLLILGCSAAKRHDAGLMPALERYDGPAFRVLRKARREGVIDEDTRVRILSAKFGLFGEGELILDYDQLMTPKQAELLAPTVTWSLYRWMREHPDCADVFVNLGQAYLPAIAGFEGWCGRNGIVCTMASGGIGTRCGQMRAWLGDGHGRTRTDTDIHHPAFDLGRQEGVKERTL